jgi:hypothetical protein
MVETTMKDADESVAESAQILVVEVAGGAAVVIERSTAGARRDGAKAHWSMAS